MAQKRMFSKDITGSDAFLDMPTSTQALYFHLGMEADDDGFIGNPKKVMRFLGASDDDLKILLSKKFILLFESGVVVVKHHRINNKWDKYNCKRTMYIEEFSQLNIKENKAYTLDKSQGIPIQSDNSLQTVSRIEENREDKNRREEKKEDAPTASKKYLTEIPDEDISSFREKYEASASQIKRKGEQMLNYCVAKGKVYKNYRAFLENGLDKDFGRRVKKLSAPIEEKKIYTPEETARIEQKKQEINNLFRVKQVS